MRHVLVVNVFFAPHSYGGATIVAEQVARALVRRGGFRVTAVSLCCRAGIADYAVLKSETEGIANYQINVPAGRSYGEAYDNPAITARIAELIHSLSPDVVHAHCLQDLGTGVITAARDQDVPVILSVHDFWWICERQFMIQMDQAYCGQDPVRIKECKGCVQNFWAAKTRFEHLQSIGNQAQLVTYPSQFAKNLCEKSGFASGRGVVWENGVRLPDKGFLKAQRKRREQDPRVVFGFVGGPSQIKGWPVIRAAFAGISSADFRVLLVDGSVDGSWWQGHDFSDLPGEWEVHSKYSQDDMDAFYAKIDVLLFMSQWKETFGLVIREALARGVRVIQTESGGSTEHGKIAQEDLIPIGPDPAPLRHQISQAIEAHPSQQAPQKIADFASQAAEFERLMSQVLVDQETA